MTTETSTLIELADVQRAAERIRGVAVRTPLLRLRGPVDGPAEIWLKPESLQLTGSFKLRGAYNKLSSLSPEERARGVVAHSSGNHAQGVACAAHLLGIKAAIVIPENAPPLKVEATKSWGAEVVRCGNSSEEREAVSRRLQEEHGYVMVPPFDDALIMAGQGTLGLEIVEDLPDVDMVLGECGGGGMISGMATAIKGLRPDALVIGVEPELAADVTESFRSGQRVRWSGEQTNRTLADGLRTQMVGVLPWEVIRRRVDEMVTVSEAEILDAVRFLARYAHLVVEPSGAVAFAAVLAGKVPTAAGRKVAVVITGGNVEPALFAAIIAGTAR